MDASGQRSRRVVTPRGPMVSKGVPLGPDVAPQLSRDPPPPSVGDWALFGVHGTSKELSWLRETSYVYQEDFLGRLRIVR